MNRLLVYVALVALLSDVGGFSSPARAQGEWSNSAYNAGTGTPNASGQKGCIIG